MDDAGSNLDMEKEICQLSLANWMHIGCHLTPMTVPTSFSNGTTLPTHVQITPPPISQPPSTLTHPVQSTSPPPQPSSAQPTSSPPPIQPELMDTVPSWISRVDLRKGTEWNYADFELNLAAVEKQCIFFGAFATPEKSKDSGEAQEEQISPSTLEAAQILTNVASEGFKGSQAPLGSKIILEEPKSKPTPTKILHFEEPAETQVNTDRKSSKEKRKRSNDEEDLQAEVQASKKSKELQELADLEEAQRLQAKMDAETQRQIDLDALLARRLVEQEEEAAKEALATEFDYIQARLNADQILAEKIQ
ncbi:hypothetical protein Tco_1144923 [Tanacetum coccineum]